MKFIHLADMHFDTPFTNLSLKGDFRKNKTYGSKRSI